MRVLAVMDGPSGVDDAYFHRVRSLLRSVEPMGVEFEEICLWDLKHKRPALMRLMNASIVRKKLIEGKFDVMHGAGPVGAYTACKAGAGLNIPTIFDIHGDAPAEAKDRVRQSPSRQAYFESWQVPWIDAQARKKSTHFLAVSTPLKEFYVGLGVPAEKISLVRNGVDIKQFTQLEFPEKRPTVIGYAGAMQIWQGLSLLIEAISKVESDDIRFLVMGFGPEDEEWLNEFKTKVGDKVELIPRQPRWRLPEYLTKTHALIIPRLPSQTVKVAMPTKFGEYLSLGRPVIVTDVDETATMVRDWGCGWVAPPDANALVDVFNKVHAAAQETLTEMGRRGRMKVEEELTWENISKHYYNALKIAVGKP